MITALLKDLLNTRRIYEEESIIITRRIGQKKRNRDATWNFESTDVG